MDNEEGPGFGHPDKLSEMLARLRVGDPRLRMEAAIALGRLHNSAAVSALIEALGDSSPRVVEEAAEALGLIGDRAAVTPLVGALGHSNSSARVGAVKGLRALRDPLSVGPLIDVLRGDSNWLCRREAAVALGDIGDPDAAAALMGALSDPDTYNQTFAVEALGKLRVVEAAPRIVLLLNNHERTQSTVEALVRIGEVSVAAILSALGGLERPYGRRNAFLVLGRLGPYSIDPLIQTLADAEPEIRALAAGALGEIGDPRAVEALSRLLRDERLVRNAAAVSLAKTGADGARVLLEASRHFDEDIREAAVAAISHLRTASFAVLVEALENGTPRIRAAAIAGLAQVGHPAFPSLVAKALCDPDADVRSAAAAEAFRDDDSPAIRAMRTALLSDRNPAVREVAVRALGKPGNESAVQDLAGLLRDPDRGVALAAVVALGRIGGVRAIDALSAPLLHDDDEFQRALAQAVNSPGVRPPFDWSHGVFSLRPDRAACLDPFGKVLRPEEQPPALTVAPPATPAAVPASWTANTEPVELVSYYPTDVRPSFWYSLLAYVCNDAARYAVEQDSRDRANSNISRRRAAGERRPDLERGAEIAIRPELAGFAVNPKEVRLRWLEDWHRADFRIMAMPAPTGPAANLSVNGHIDFLVNGLIAGRTPVSIFVGDDAARPSDGVAKRSLASARPFQAIFASYCHEDSIVVEAVGRAYRALGNQFLRDVESLRSGEVWRGEIRGFIDRADIFQLFWSAASKRSKYVEMEWRHALNRGLADFIRPVFWERPMPSPPEELSGLHFAYFAP